MTVRELALELHRAYTTANKGHKISRLIHFGIKVAPHISPDIRVIDIVKQSAIRRSATNEIYTGIKIAKYLDSKK